MMMFSHCMQVSKDGMFKWAVMLNTTSAGNTRKFAVNMTTKHIVENEHQDPEFGDSVHVQGAFDRHLEHDLVAGVKTEQVAHMATVVTLRVTVLCLSRYTGLNGHCNL